MSALKKWLAELTDEQSDRLKRELESGRVTPGDSEPMLRALSLPAAWAGQLQALKAAGWTRETLLQALELAGKRRSDDTSPVLQLVSSQAGASAANTMDTAVVLRQLFEQATERVLLAGFRITDKSLLEHLRRREAHALDIELFLHFRSGQNAWGFERGPRDTDYEDSPQGCWRQFVERIWPSAMDPPTGWYSPDIFHAEDHANMHVKAAVVDGQRTYISSANFTAAAQYRNVELGLLIEDEGISAGVEAHFQGLVRSRVFEGLQVVSS